ncbi:hypothetical protein [Desulfitobacterium dehalogenans]|uniref:hypothetical protein n=1 Tax=Desulfitobacterium dehalogenans TaxID=36854 RepID=UPI0013053DD2|nr:hypothetical protein [Desulfitobacterium dehalogenans]
MPTISQEQRCLMSIDFAEVFMKKAPRLSMLVTFMGVCAYSVVGMLFVTLVWSAGVSAF